MVFVMSTREPSRKIVKGWARNRKLCLRVKGSPSAPASCCVGCKKAPLSLLKHRVTGRL